MFGFKKSKPNTQTQDKPQTKGGLFSRLKQQLSKTRTGLTEGLSQLILGKKNIDDELLEDIEAQLVMADVGIEATQEIIKNLTDRLNRKTLKDAESVLIALKEDMASILKPVSQPFVIPEDKKPFAHPFEHLSDLTEIIRAVKPTALIGVSGQAQAFTKNAIRTLADIHDNPVIFALSNPTSKSECTAEQAYQWTNGKCVFASGSPFDPVEINGETHVPGQGNNAYVFPGVGLGVVASKADRVTDEMFLIASEIISKSLSPNDLDHGRVFPPLTQIRDLSLEIATTIAEFETDENKIDFIREMMYKAEYQDYI